MTCGTSTVRAEEDREEDYKLWPANKSDSSWQSLSNLAYCYSFVQQHVEEVT